MIRNYTVFSAVEQRVSAPLELSNGAIVQAEIPAFVTQLVPEVQGNGGTIQLIETADIAGATALFVPGRTIQVTFAGV